MQLRKLLWTSTAHPPKEAIIPWKQFCAIAEAMGFDLDQPAKADLRATRRDWRHGKSTAFVPLAKL